MITRAIENAMQTARNREWTKTYWAFDIHDTMIVANYQPGNIPKEFYPFAKETLQLISQRSDIVMILFSCSHPHELAQYDAHFRENEILFDHININPEIENNALGFYDQKLYYNVLFEDKAGFDPESDWKKVHELVQRIPLLG
jgi:hypothetical protein